MGTRRAAEPGRCLGGLGLAGREPAEGHEGEDREPDPGEEERDPDDDPEQCDLLREERGVQRVRQCGLRHPQVPGRVLDRPLRLRIDRGEGRVVRVLAVLRQVAAHLRVRLAAGGLEGVDPHVGGEALGPRAAVDRLAGDVARRDLIHDLGGEVGLLGLGEDRRLVHVLRADDVLALDVGADLVPPVDAHPDRAEAERDEDRGCDVPADLEKLLLRHFLCLLVERNDCIERRHGQNAIRVGPQRSCGEVRNGYGKGY